MKRKGRIDGNGKCGGAICGAALLLVLIIAGTGFAGTNLSWLSLLLGGKDDVATKVIGSEGGVVAFPEGSVHDGTKLVVPKGALSKDTEIKISVVEDLGLASGAAMVKLEPSGLKFDVPSTLTIKYSQGYVDRFGIEEA